MNWNGSILVNGTEMPTNFDISTLQGDVVIKLLPKGFKPLDGAKTSNNVGAMNDDTLYRITVRQYMTKVATPDFDFMAKWNNNVPMPLRTMVGRKIKETNGMVYMSLYGDILQRVTQCCMKCGRPITNPISKFFGMGPECGGHNYTHPFDTDEELKEAVENYRLQLRKITWEGWMPKSAITEQEVVDNENS